MVLRKLTVNDKGQFTLDERVVNVIPVGLPVLVSLPTKVIEDFIVGTIGEKELARYGYPCPPEVDYYTLSEREVSTVSHNQTRQIDVSLLRALQFYRSIGVGNGSTT